MRPTSPEVRQRISTGIAMGLKKVIKWALVCGQRKMQSRKSPMHFVCSKSYADGNRETRRLLVLLEDLRQLYAAAWGKVMASLETCFDAMQGREPGLLKSMCSVVLLWVQLGDTVAKDFDPDLWRQPTLQSINDLNDALLRLWKVAMDKTAELVYKIIPVTTADVAMVIEKEYQACRQETWTLFQVTPDTLENYVDTLKLYTSNVSLWHLDERKFLNTDATLVKSLSQLNIAAS
ncbi:uncharacterized protein LOC142572574 isoform X1 [Dermacentor variabilis]|uniref:uncharacterized protein LOC142572574 isoform X1 n=1 Tax=Dermacentor variabilis TaxID=34621 RepID=UPI003F5AFBF2